MCFFSMCYKSQSNKVKPTGILRMSILEHQNKLNSLKYMVNLCEKLTEDFKYVLMDCNDLELYSANLPPKFEKLDELKKRYKKLKKISYQDLIEDLPLVLLETNLKAFRKELLKDIKTPDKSIYEPEDNCSFWNKRNKRIHYLKTPQSLKGIPESLEQYEVLSTP